MQEWINQTLGSPTISLVVLAASLLLGLVAAVSSCCTLPVIGLIAGYSGTSSGQQKNREIISAFPKLKENYLKEYPGIFEFIYTNLNLNKIDETELS